MRKSILHQTTLGVVGALVVVAVTLGIFRNTVIPQPARESQTETQGASLFKDKGCAHCHATDSTKAKMGPGLKGLFDRKTLPASGRPVTEENVREQLKNPYKNMPSFAKRLTDDEGDKIVAYLKSL